MDNTQQLQNQNQAQPVQENTIVDFSGSNITNTPQSNGNASSVLHHSGQQSSNVSTHSSMQTSGGVTHHKETEPMPSFSEPAEWLQSVEEKVELEPEVEEAGVEAISQTPQISEQEKSLGLKLAKETMPMEKEPSSRPKYSMTKAQAKQAAKGFLIMKDTSNPMLWLALLILRQVQMQEKQNNSEGVNNVA